LGLAIEFYFFGDDQHVRHLRVVMDTDDKDVAEACLNLNIRTWIAALEVAVILATRKPFQVATLPLSEQFAVGFAEGDQNHRAAVFKFPPSTSAAIDYDQVIQGFAAWNADIKHHLFYFRRLVDDSLPLDVRWLNGYRMLEWHFVRHRAKLPSSREWRLFVERFEQKFVRLPRPRQSLPGFLEEARALAAHAGIDDRPASIRQSDPQNAMEKTFRIIEEMAMTVLNEHPSRAKNSIRFELLH
jgi:hypothetical protein